MGNIKHDARLRSLLGASAAALAMMLASPALAKPTRFNIPSEDAVQSIPEFARQAGLQIVAPADRLRGVRTPAVKGTLEPREALALLLRGTGLEIASDNGRVITLRRASEERANPPAQVSQPAGDPPSEAVQLSELLIEGHRTLNVDIARSRDDIQPYVVFGSEQIAQSGAQNIEDFLQASLPMNAQQQTLSQLGPQTSPRGRIDLRGLGSAQTLILVDGRRLPSISTGDSFGQPYINGISMSQIERIEVLPTTASGIYGGGATGGVINIILKRNYSGLDVDLGYANAFDTDVGQSRIGLNGGFSLEDGRTTVMVAASKSQANELLSSDRDFFRRGALLQLRNDPSEPSVLFGGPNICSTVDGFTCSDQALVLTGGASLTSPFTSVPRGYTGPASDAGAGLAANAGRLRFKGAGVPLWSTPDTISYSLDVRREFTDRVEAFVAYSRDESETAVTMPSQLTQYVPAGPPDNPFQQDVLSFISIPDGIEQRQEIENSRLNVGVIVRLPFKWSAALEYDWLQNTTRSSNSSVLGTASPAADAILQGAAFRDITKAPLTDPDSLFLFFAQSGENGDTLETVSLRLSGPVMELPGGSLTATALVERRDETSETNINTTSFGGTEFYFWTPAARRNVQSQYLELRGPVISSENRVPWVDSFELMGSVRHDSYETEFSGSSILVAGPDGPFPAQTASTNRVSSTDYTVGLRYSPTQDIAFRASYGTGFLPPSLAQIRSDAPNVFSPFLISLLDLRDPARGNDLIPGPLTILGGGSPSLTPEQSESTSLGLVFTPRFLRGLRVSIDATSVLKTDEVVTLPLAFFIENEADFPGRITRGPNLPGDPPGLPGPITQIDFTSLNLATSKLKAIDVQVDYMYSSEDFGDWRFYAVATQTSELSRKVLAGDASIDRVGFADGPLKWRANFGIDWNRGPWKAGWNAQYYDSYQVCASYLSSFVCGLQETWQGSAKIPSQIYHDAYLRYASNEPEGVWADTEIRVGVQNIFNETGPTIASGVTYSNGPAAFGDPRLRRFTLSVRKHF